MNLTPELQAYVDAWRNEDAYNNHFHAEMTARTNETPYLKAHRDWIEGNQHGFGDRAFHYCWKMLVDAMPQEFSFLEIGVFKGQVLSLVGLVARECGKTANIYGATTLTNTEDMRCRYPQGDYEMWIYQIFDVFKVSMERVHLIEGRSDAPKVIEEVRKREYDCAYIDGGHDLADVVSDIHNYAPQVKVGGFFVMDDSSIGRLNVGSAWPGLEDVAQAVKEHLDTDERFRFMLAVGHLNVFYRVK